MGRKIILAGGSGLVGDALARRLVREGWEVVVLTRDSTEYQPVVGNFGRSRAVEWDATTAKGAWVEELAGADALVNFTGRSVNCVHNAENKRAILESRVNSVKALGAAMAKSATRPKVWVQCSAVGYYGNRGLPPCDETAAAGNTFLADVCRQWEAAFAESRPAEVRPVVLRLATVLAGDGGALPPLKKVARAGLGGAAGSGRQGMTWIHLDDLTTVFQRVLEDEALRGTFNACATEPVYNKEFMQTLRRAVGRPWCPPAPAWVIKVVAPIFMKTDASLVLEGQFCRPAALENSGFEFKYPQLAAALSELLGRE